MNAATDNPMVFAETGELLSGGNFHGEPVAIAADVLAIAVAELGAISERRIERLVNPALSGLPAFLARDGGLQSGLMIAHVTAAALASENKALAHPASVDSIPTSANKEDHVSMGVTAARKAARVVANTRRILAIELLAACQALEFLKPLLTSPALQAGVRSGAPARPALRPRPRARARDRGGGRAGGRRCARRGGRLGLRYAGVSRRRHEPPRRRSGERRGFLEPWSSASRSGMLGPAIGAFGPPALAALRRPAGGPAPRLRRGRAPLAAARR